MHVNTKVTKCTLFSQVFFQSWGVKLQSICHRAGLCHRLIMTRSTVWAAESYLQSHTASHERTILGWDNIILQETRGRNVCLTVQSGDSAELRRERSGEKGRGKQSRLHLRGGAQICYSEGGLRVRSVPIKKRPHSEEELRHRRWRQGCSHVEAYFTLVAVLENR